MVGFLASAEATLSWTLAYLEVLAWPLVAVLVAVGLGRPLVATAHEISIQAKGVNILINRKVDSMRLKHDNGYGVSSAETRNPRLASAKAWVAWEEAMERLSHALRDRQPADEQWAPFQANMATLAAHAWQVELLPAPRLEALTNLVEIYSVATGSLQKPKLHQDEVEFLTALALQLAREVQDA